MQLKTILATAICALSIGAAQAGTVRVNTFGAFTASDMVLVATICEQDDIAALKQMYAENRFRKLSEGTQVFVLDRSGLLDQVRIQGTSDLVWVYRAAITE